MTRRRPIPFVLLSALLAALVILGAAIGPGGAAFAAKVSANVGKPLKEAQDRAAAGDINGAIAKAKEAQQQSPKTAYDDYVLNDYLAYLYNSKKDYRNAIVALEAALKYPQATDKAKRIKTIAQLAYQIKDCGKTTTYTNRYLKEVGPDEALQLLIANCYYQARNYSAALAQAKTIVEQADAAGRAPTKASLAMMLSCAYIVKDTATIKNTLFRLVSNYPSQQYWSTLLKMIEGGGLGDFIAYEERLLKWRLGLLVTGDDYFNVAKFAVALGVPGDGQRILEEGFAKKLLGKAPNERDQRLLTFAKDGASKAKAGLAAADAAAAAAATGEADIKVGLSYASFGERAKAIAVMKRGLAKPDLAKPDEARLSLGRIYIEAGQIAEGRRVLASIKTDSGLKDVARAMSIAAGRG